MCPKGNNGWRERRHRAPPPHRSYFLRGRRPPRGAPARIDKKEGSGEKGQGGRERDLGTIAAYTSQVAKVVGEGSRGCRW